MEFLLAFLDLLHEELSSTHVKTYFELKESAILEEMVILFSLPIGKRL